ncbi:transcription antitermination factor NusB [Pseudogracilibacillus sp. SO30301A]|uniref:transcription antitermination factor NusB n=1 Tax=Pseudogracilibacillus sp. SO30301A TaxID=3098291 RepID=UPI00300E2745
MDRRTAREEAFKLLFQHEINTVEEINSEKLDPFTKKIVLGVIDKKEEIDQLISNHLKNWSYERVALVEKTVLRIAVFEITYLDDIPIGVSINEAVELSHTYGDEKSGKFVNGVLSNIIEQKES